MLLTIFAKDSIVDVWWVPEYAQGFPNSVKGWGGGEILPGGYFLGQWEPEEEWFWPFKLFSKAQKIFCKYWTLIKIKSSMTCEYKEYEGKIKMMQKQWLQLKVKFLLGYNRWGKK